MKLLNQRQLGSRAQKGINLAKYMDKTFPFGETITLDPAHLKIVVMAVVQDAYKEGYTQCLEDSTPNNGKVTGVEG